MAKKKKEVDVGIIDIDMIDDIPNPVEVPEPSAPYVSVDAAPFINVLIRVVNEVGHSPACKSRNHVDLSKCDCYMVDAKKILPGA